MLLTENACIKPFLCQLLVYSFEQKAINCQNLKSSSGVFSDLGRRVSSFIFGSQPASYKVAVSVSLNRTFA